MIPAVFPKLYVDVDVAALSCARTMAKDSGETHQQTK